MWLSRTSFLLVVLVVGLVTAEKSSNDDDASNVFVEEAKNLFSQKSIDNMAQTFSKGNTGKQVWCKSNSAQSY